MNLNRLMIIFWDWSNKSWRSSLTNPDISNELLLNPSLQIGLMPFSKHKIYYLTTIISHLLFSCAIVTLLTYNTMISKALYLFIRIALSKPMLVAFALCLDQKIFYNSQCSHCFSYHQLSQAESLLFFSKPSVNTPFCTNFNL